MTAFCDAGPTWGGPRLSLETFVCTLGTWLCSDPGWLKLGVDRSVDTVEGARLSLREKTKNKT